MAEPMNPADVPSSHVKAAFDAQVKWLDANPGLRISDDLAMRIALAAVLLLHEQQVRERIASDLERKSNNLDQDAERHADERSPLLSAESEALWSAAWSIREGKDDGDA
jgi:hypothetical protein